MLPKINSLSIKGTCNKDGTNLVFYSYRISSKFRIRIVYSVAPNLIRMLNGVEMSWLDRVAGEFYATLFCEVYSFR